MGAGFAASFSAAVELFAPLACRSFSSCHFTSETTSPFLVTSEATASIFDKPVLLPGESKRSLQLQKERSLKWCSESSVLEWLCDVWYSPLWLRGPQRQSGGTLEPFVNLLSASVSPPQRFF